MKTNKLIVIATILFIVTIMFLFMITDSGRRIALEAELQSRSNEGDNIAKRELALHYVNTEQNKKAWQIIKELEAENDVWARYTLLPQHIESYYMDRSDIPLWEQQYETYRAFANEGYRAAYEDIFTILYNTAIAKGADSSLSIISQYEYWAKRYDEAPKNNEDAWRLHLNFSNLAKLYEYSKIFDKAHFWHTKAVINENACTDESMLRVLAFDYFGVGTARDVNLAADYARSFGQACSLPFLGKFYINGELTGQSEVVQGCPMIYAAWEFPALRLNLSQYKSYCDENTAEEKDYILSMANVYTKAIQAELAKNPTLQSAFYAVPNIKKCADNYDSDCALVWARTYLEKRINDQPDYDSALILYRIYKLSSSKQELENNEIAALEGIIAYRDGDTAKAQRYLEISANGQHDASLMARDLLGKIYYAQGFRVDGCARSLLADYDPRSILRCKELLSSEELAGARQYAADIIKSGSNAGRWMFP